MFMLMSVTTILLVVVMTMMRVRMRMMMTIPATITTAMTSTMPCRSGLRVVSGQIHEGGVVLLALGSPPTTGFRV